MYNSVRRASVKSLYLSTFSEVDLDALRTLGEEEHWMIRPTEVNLLPQKVLGRGGYGVVLCGVFYGTPVAVKVPHGDVIDNMSKMLRSLSNELRVLRQLRHRNLVPFHGAVVDPDRLLIGIILELVRGGDLNAFMTEDGGPSLCIEFFF